MAEPFALHSDSASTLSIKESDFRRDASAFLEFLYIAFSSTDSLPGTKSELLDKFFMEDDDDEEEDDNFPVKSSFPVYLIDPPTIGL